MPSQIALFACIFFSLYLFNRDRRLRPMTSGALWIVLLWVVILGTRPVSLWFGMGAEMENPESYLNGSPLDRALFLVLIIAGMLVLFMRRESLNLSLVSNSWVFLVFAYWFLSIIWSDYPFVAFKRWIKDFGNLVIVMIILTEPYPMEAVRAVLARYTYIVIPLSVVFIKYFPNIGRYYNRWTYEPSYCGITLEKNALGCIVFICGLYMVWDFIETRRRGAGNTDKIDSLCRLMLACMGSWLLIKADSSTAVVCLALGIAILLLVLRPFAVKHVMHLGAYSVAAGLLILLLSVFPGILGTFVELLGRNETLTGRTDLWNDILSVRINPLLGAGYQSFWLGPRALSLWEKYYFHPNQAHNGYLETYLNGGFLGLSLLIAMIASTGSRLKKELLAGSTFGAFRFSFLVAALFYNCTEAAFNTISLVWLIMLLAAFHDPLFSRSQIIAWELSTEWERRMGESRFQWPNRVA